MGGSPNESPKARAHRLAKQREWYRANYEKIRDEYNRVRRERYMKKRKTNRGLKPA